VTPEIISRNALRHLERHFVCVVDVFLPHFIRKTHTKWRSRWRNAWREIIL